MGVSTGAAGIVCDFDVGIIRLQIASDGLEIGLQALGFQWKWQSRLLLRFLHPCYLHLSRCYSSRRQSEIKCGPSSRCRICPRGRILSALRSIDNHELRILGWIGTGHWHKAGKFLRRVRHAYRNHYDLAVHRIVIAERIKRTNLVRRSIDPGGKMLRRRVVCALRIQPPSIVLIRAGPKIIHRRKSRAR